jgi:Domain of Unknown Function with PDB structure (DUF3857)/Protein of unknown function (DUF2569)/Transglutaminase-like superfamily
MLITVILPSHGSRGRSPSLRLFFKSILLLLSVWTCAIVLAESKLYSVAPAPSWIQVIETEDAATAPAEQLSGGVYYVLADTQTRIDGNDKVRFRHTAIKAVSPAGVEKIAQIEIRFDPEYEKLTLHSINVRREGRVIPKLARAVVRVLQREKELEYRIYDGSKTANVFLDDVRVGDIVEYSFSVRGTNPVFAGKQFGTFDMRWSVPIHRLYQRLQVPASRDFAFLHYRTELRPVVTEAGGYRNYLWDVKNIAPLSGESGTPNWFDPYAFVSWGEFKDWESVARWAQPLYRPPARLESEIQTEVNRIAAANPDAGGRLLAVLQFVQREIRYLGVEIGAGSHAPNPPATVFRRRFGDCKDKSMLVTTMLRAMGIEASPALVNTRINRGVADRQPSPGAFNHVIVRARVDGRDYWIDPTRPPQKGALENLHQPDFGFALVIDPATRDLTHMPEPRAYKRSIKTVLDTRAGFDQPAPYTVTITFEGESAEQQRNKLARENRAEVEKQYLNFYAKYYPELATAAPLEITDNESANTLTTVESYTIQKLWKRSEEHKRLEMYIQSPDINDQLLSPKEPIRTAPLSVDHPIDLVQTTEVLLPTTWEFSPDHTKIDDPAFLFEQTVTSSEKKVVVIERLRSLTDHVQPEDVTRYAANLKKARAALGYSLYKPDRAPENTVRGLKNFNWSVAFFGLICTLAWVWCARRLYVYDPRENLAPIDSSLRGIRGWLILPAISIVLTPFMSVGYLVKSLPAYGASSWDVTTTVTDASYHALRAPLLLFELSYYLALIVFSVVLVILFFNKRRHAPQVFLGILACAAFFSLIDLLLVQELSPQHGDDNAKEWLAVVFQFIKLAIWALYFSRSRRAKATFTATLAGPPLTPPPAP